MRLPLWRSRPAFLLIALLSACADGAGPLCDSCPERPNFIVILTDDLDMPMMEHLDRVARHMTQEGMQFTNSFVNVSLCCPSRASFLRGQYAHNHSILTNNAPWGGFQRFRHLGRENSTLATWLQDAGYRTVLLGKYMNGYTGRKETYIPPGWFEWYATVNDHYFGFRVNENGIVFRYPCCDVYETDLLSARAVDFIRRTAATGTPFLVYLAPYAPHVDAIPADRHLGAFDHVSMPRSPALNEADVSDKPSFIRVLPPRSERSIGRMEDEYRRQLAAMLAVEDMLDSLLSTLESTGLMEQTYIFFTSDNGWHRGEHRLNQGKGMAYNEDIHVPLLVRGPGVPRGGVIPEIALNIDLAPTIAELAGVATPSFVDGRSLVPLLRGGGGGSGWRDAFPVQRWSFEPNPTIWVDHGYRALRTLDHLYVEWDNGEIEFYDRRNDPYELESLHATTDPAELLRMSEWVSRLSACAGDGCRAAERAP